MGFVSRSLVVLMIGFFVPACAHVQPPAVVPDLPRTPVPVVFVADGAGDFRACSTALRKTAAEDRLPLEVITFVWSHGYLRNFEDQTDFPHARRRGENLAQVVLHHRQTVPDAPVSLVGHSAGSAVVLAAAEHLPPGSVDRIVLLSPSLSANYDLHPALRAARDGIDVFISDQDWIWLGLLIRICGAVDDPLSSQVAGRFGFVPRANDPDYAKLRLHRWAPSLKIFGNDGGHFGGYQPAHLRTEVFPLLAGGMRPMAP